MSFTKLYFRFFLVYLFLTAILFISIATLVTGKFPPDIPKLKKFSLNLGNNMGTISDHLDIAKMNDDEIVQLLDKPKIGSQKTDSFKDVDYLKQIEDRLLTQEAEIDRLRKSQVRLIREVENLKTKFVD